MDKETKQALATILSEIYELKNQILKLQNENSEFRIEALKCGYEHIINEELGIHDNQFEFPLTEVKYDEILKCLDDYERENSVGIENLTGFYDFPSEIQNRFSRIEWLYAFKAMKAEHRFNNIISRIEDSQNSPAEFHNL